MTIGAEYYAPEFLAPFNRLVTSCFKCEPLKTCCSLITDGDHGSADYDEGGIPFVLSEAIEEGRILRESCRFITPRHAKTLERSKLKTGDVLVTKTGVYFGISAVVNPSFAGANTIAHVGILRPKEYFDSYFFSTFLNCLYGQVQLRRRGIKTSRPEIKLLEFDDIEVPKCSDQFQKAVRTKVLESLAIYEAIENDLADANQILLQALGLENWQPPETLTYIRSFSETFDAARLDAEHFRPKFAALLAKMKEHGKIVRLGDCVRFCERGRQPQYAEEGLPVINSRHVRTNVVVIDEDNRFAVEDTAQLKLNEEDRLTIKQGDLLINGTGVGTMGRCAPYLRKEKALPDNHVTILRMKPDTGLEPVFLSVQLNSIIGQMQVEQYFKGSSGQIELYPSEIKEFRIWLAPSEIQRQITSYFDEAHRSRQDAQTLLAKAKRAVEVAIEDGEEKALKMLL